MSTSYEAVKITNVTHAVVQKWNSSFALEYFTAMQMCCFNSVAADPMTNLRIDFEYIMDIIVLLLGHSIVSKYTALLEI